MKVFFRGLYQRDFDWIEKQVNFKKTEDYVGFVAIDENTQEYLGAVIFDNFLANCAQATLIIKNPLIIKYGWLDLMHDFIFKVQKCTYVYSIVAANNIRSLRLTKKLGFSEKMRMPDAFKPGVDMVVLQLHKNNWLSGEKHELLRVA